MDFNAVVRTLSISPYLAARTFLTMFIAGLLGRVSYAAIVDPTGAAHLTLGTSAMIAGYVALPLWYISNFTLLVLLGFTVWEHIAENSDSWFNALESFKTNVIKPGAGFVLTFGTLDAQSRQIFQHMRAFVPDDVVLALAHTMPVHVASAGAVDLQQAQIAGAIGLLTQVFIIGWSALMAFGTWFIARIRDGVMDVIADFDEGGLGLRKLFGYFEGGWAVSGMVLMVILPQLSLLLFVLTIGGLFATQKWFERQAERTKVPCATCATPIFPMAPVCFSCHATNASVRSVGLFGQPKKQPATDPQVHRLNLLARKRCPRCASRLKAKAIQQACPTCQVVTFDSMSDVNIYLRSVGSRLWPTMLVCGLFSLIPVVGMVPGVIFYRLSLVASLKGYLPAGVGCFTKTGIRIAALVLVAFQWVPFVGALMLPLMCLLNYSVYRNVVYSTAVRTFVTKGADAAAAATAGRAPVMAHAAGMSVAVATAAPAQTPQVAVGNAHRFCTTCGHSRHDNATFCTKCGQPFRA